MKSRSFILPALALILLAFSIIQVVRAQQKPPQPQPPIEPARTIFGKTVAGAGIVEARSENISIGSPSRPGPGSVRSRGEGWAKRSKRATDSA